MSFEREKEKQKKAKVPFLAEVSTKEKIIDKGCVVVKGRFGREKKVCPSDGQKYKDALEKLKAQEHPKKLKAK